jgi:hypothetical protein
MMTRDEISDLRALMEAVVEREKELLLAKECAGWARNELLQFLYKHEEVNINNKAVVRA